MTEAPHTARLDALLDATQTGEWEWDFTTGEITWSPTLGPLHGLPVAHKDLHNTAGIHELLITLFLFLTAPVSAIMIAKAHIFRHRDVQQTLSKDAGGSGWATLSAAPDASEPTSARAPVDFPASPNA